MAGAGQNIMDSSGGFGAGGYNRTTKTIGSIKNRQINYSPEHTFFNPKTDTRPIANEIKAVVKNEIDKDLLGSKAAKWNQSVALPESSKMGGDFHKDLSQNH